jgi:hypothetical protein
MSLDLYIWDSAVSGSLPCSYAEADETFAKLVEVKTGVNPKFIQFAERLSALIQAMPEPDDELLDYYADIVSQTQQVEEAVYVIGLPSFNFIEATRLIVQSAAEFNLIVMDGQSSATVFLPNGQTVPPERAAIWKSAWTYMDEQDEFPKTLVAFKKKVEPMIAAMAERRGFVKGKHPSPNPASPTEMKAKGYVRDVELGKQFVHLSYEGGRGDYRVSVDTFFENKEFQEVIEQFDFKYSNKILTLPITYMKEFFTGGGGLQVCDQQELNTLINKLDRLFYPFLDQLRTVKDIDSFYNGELSQKLWRSYIYPNSLITARLVDNPLFEEFVSQANKLEPDQWAGPNCSVYKVELPKLVKYLREEVKPIV